MLISILAHIIVFLGFAALAAIITALVVITWKKMISLIKEKLAKKFGGTIAIIDLKRVANEAIKEAKRTGNQKNLAELEKMVAKEGVVMAVQDANGNISSEDIDIYQAEQMDSQVYEALGENGVLVLEA